ncbi:GNAT family N-acetyltransferase [Falsiroseomonas sp.]|uniref:GNAT family N-acetyltransferase n=1 Tax=Falsiroseomonas sp. TaxID=2870721 RepID=UPI00271AF339|nr:GNAT family N-acetyltransferase [Falsiroseomonas sp.]MDO9499337.1 GNAT family N-acetyltransferase [Falsiroseomonas sp.]
MPRITDAAIPGSLGRLIGLHGPWYSRHWGFGLPFEAKVAVELGAFAASLPREDSRLFLALAEDGAVLGGLALDGRDGESARIRWFILAEEARGGLGRRLLQAALDFADQRGFASVWLTTFAGLDAARRLYESAGFRLEAEAPETGWGVAVSGQRFVRPFPGPLRAVG